IKWERKLKKGGARCKHRPPPKMTHQQDLTKSQKNLQFCGKAHLCFHKRTSTRIRGNPILYILAIEL
ncbi:hypothetical protein EFT48_08320, partial [Limosilactobacillus fermentum]|nr:hypothetical protein [Limosilactobacillus fermentum]